MKLPPIFIISLKSTVTQSPPSCMIIASPSRAGMTCGRRRNHETPTLLKEPMGGVHQSYKPSL
eukprot:5496958-Karenia_brevis.AAC.1